MQIPQVKSARQSNYANDQRPKTHFVGMRKSTQQQDCEANEGYAKQKVHPTVNQDGFLIAKANKVRHGQRDIIGHVIKQVVKLVSQVKQRNGNITQQDHKGNCLISEQ